MLCLAAGFVASVGCAPSYHPMKALMIVGGQAHDYTTLPFELADTLNRRGDVDVDVNTDVLSLSAKQLEPYRVLIFNDCQRPQLSEEFKQAVIHHVQSGKGLVVMHCSLWSYVDWPEWRKMVGGHVETHDKYTTYDVVVLDPSHAAMLGVGDRFTITDEPYLVDQRDPSDIVLAETAEPRHDNAGRLRPGPDPQVWVKRYGKGRIFVTTFGHGAASQQSEPFISLLHNGIRWAGGLLADSVHNQLTHSESLAGYKLLFNGRDLSGWTGDPALWTVENGELVGRATSLPRDSFIVRRDPAGDFTLRLSFRLVWGNSGVQVRSTTEPAEAARPMKGPQVELVAGKWGSVFNYGDGERQQTGGLTAEQARAVIPDGWNDVIVEAVGPQLTVTVNGLTAAQFRQADSDSRAGLIGLQLHRGEANEIHFRDIRLGSPLATRVN